jgi:hypothetical protein
MTRRHIACVDHPLSPDVTESIPPPHLLVSQNSTPDITSHKWTHAYRRKYPHQPLRRNSDDSIYIQAILHKVKKNDTVAGISLFYGISVSNLATLDLRLGNFHLWLTLIPCSFQSSKRRTDYGRMILFIQGEYYISL